MNWQAKSLRADRIVKVRACRRREAGISNIFKDKVKGSDMLTLFQG